MDSQTVYSIFGLFQAIAVICLALLVAGGFAWAAGKVFTDSNS